MFKNAVETLNYFAEQCKAFGPIKEEFIKLTEENNARKGVIESLGKQLAEEKLNRIKNEEALNVLGKQLIESKINSIKGGN